jgi:hypothetical protein
MGLGMIVQTMYISILQFFSQFSKYHIIKYYKVGKKQGY